MHFAVPKHDVLVIFLNNLTNVFNLSDEYIDLYRIGTQHIVTTYIADFKQYFHFK